MRRLIFLLLLVPALCSAELRPPIEDVLCLAQNIYFEARNQSVLGKEAVAEVVLNRVKSTRYPNTVCGVVKQARKYQGKVLINRCQFSWYCDGESDTPTDTPAWTDSVRVSHRILIMGQRTITKGSTHYHTTAVNPYWSESLRRVVQIDDHIFYKE